MNLTVPHFDLAKTLHGGQMFNYFPAKKGYVLIIKDKAISIEQQGTTLTFDCDEAFIHHYFSLDFDIKQFHKQLKKNKLTHLIPAAQGLRLLRQDPWETMLTFVLSSNANMHKIRTSLHNLTRTFGTPIHHNDTTYYTIPRPGHLNDLNKIKAAGTGYRAPYVHALNTLNEDWIAKLTTLPYAKAKEHLMTLPGIGSKVADCICIYGLHHWEAFPIDIWVKRALEHLYFKQSQPLKKLETFAQTTFGDYRGWTQQYLFEWKRTTTNKTRTT